MDHPTEETLKRFAAGTASRGEGRTVVAHLLKGCPRCAAGLRSLIEPRSVDGGSYEAALDRFDETLIEALETSIPPWQTLRALLRDILDPERLDPKRRGEE